MQKIKLPLSLDPYRAALKRLDYVGYYPKESAVRLADAVLSIESDIDTDFSFSIDLQGLTIIIGQSCVDVMLICQRCNKPFKRSMCVKLSFSPVKSDEQAQALPEYYDSVEVNEFNEVNLLKLVEDEILLSLPIVPVHDPEHCEVSDVEFVFGELPEEDNKPNPFSALTQLKKK